MIRWWHRVMLHHTQTQQRVSVPFFDPGAKGILVKCDCGERWAL